MSLDGLRAWIGEVERKLGMRTRVFLVLAVIAIGGAGAAIYLAIDTRENAVSESDVQALQEKLEARIAASAAAAASEPVPEPEPEPEAVSPESKPAKPEAGGAAAEPETEAQTEPTHPEAGGGGADNGGGSSKGGKPPTLAERLRQAREANAKAEREVEEKK
jgi:hypothetical protein